MTRCKYCGKDKPPDAFRPNNKSRCRECWREYDNACHKIKSKKRTPGVPFIDHSNGKLYIPAEGRGRKIYWNSTMLHDLKAYFSDTPNDELAGILGVSKRTMIRKARELGLEKSKEFMAKYSREGQLMARIANKRNGNSGMYRKGHKFTGNQYTGKIEV